MSDQLAIPIGEVLRDVGMMRTLEAESEAWIDRALDQMRLFARIPGWQEFKTEDFRAWVAPRIGHPHSANVWGALTTKACKRGIIRWTGRYVASVSEKTHAHPVKLWRGC